MSGIQMALLGGGASGIVVSTGNYVDAGKVTFYYYGYYAATTGALPAFGSVTSGTFGGATVKAIYSLTTISAGNASAYSVIFNGNRSAGFFNTLTVDGTLVTGTLSAPSYSAGDDETSFSITLAATAATLFGTTDGVLIPVVMT